MDGILARLLALNEERAEGHRARAMFVVVEAIPATVGPGLPDRDLGRLCRDDDDPVTGEEDVISGRRLALARGCYRLPDITGWCRRGETVSDNGEERGRRLLTNRRLLGLVVAALLSMLLVLFALDNFVLIEIRLMNARIEMRLAWALLVAVLGGGALGFLAGRYLR